MSQQTHGKPPPIGETLGEAYRIYKGNFGPIFIGALCAMVAGMVPLIGPFMSLPGLYYVGLKAVRGEKIEPADGFIAFKKLGDHIVLGLLKISGLLLCLVGVYVTNPLFAPGSLLIIDKNMTWSQAKDACLKDVKPHFFSWFLFDLVIVFVPVIVGMLLCFIGIYVTIPIVGIAMGYAHEKAMKSQDATLAQQ